MTKKKINELPESKKDELCQFILKYLSSKNYDFEEIIIWVYRIQKNREKECDNYCDINHEHGFKKQLEIIQSCLRDNNKQIRSCHSIDERNELEDECKFYKSQIEFLNDLTKIQKILQNREISITKGGILEIFFSFIQLERFRYFSKLLETYLKKWKENIGDKHSIELILKEVTNTKFDFFSDDDDAILNAWGYQWILKQFGYDYDLDSIKKQLQPIIEKRELDRFEKALDNPSIVKNKQLSLIDFSTLNGYAFEEFVANLFKKMGYTVDITPKSRDQGADLIIRRDIEVTAVQVKNYTQQVSNSAIQEVVAAKKYYQANKAMVVTSSYFTPSAVDLAYVNDVILWDGDKLKQILSKELGDIQCLL